MVTDTRHGIHEVEHEVSVLIWIQTKGDDIVIDLIPITHVNRTVGVDDGIHRVLRQHITKANRHPRCETIVETVQFHRVHHQLLGHGITGQQQQMIAHMQDIPCTVHSSGWALRNRFPNARSVEHHDGGNSVGPNRQQGVVATLEVQSILVGCTAWLNHAVRLPPSVPGPLFVHTQQTRGGQRSNKQRAVGKRRKSNLRLHVGHVCDGLLGERAPVVHPQRKVGTCAVAVNERNRHTVIGEHDG